MKIKFGSIVTDGSGKLGGHVYSKNRGGNYIRTNKVPSNPRTEAQILARSRFGLASSGWRALSESQRAAWAEFASNNPYTDSLGDQRTLSASSAYTRSQNNLMNVGKAPITSPSDVQEEVIIEGFGSTFTAPGTAIINFVRPNLSYIGGAKLLVKASHPFPASQKYAGNKMRIVGNYDASDIVSPSEDLDISTEYASNIGALVQGMRVAWEVFLIDSNGMSKFIAGGSDIVS